MNRKNTTYDRKELIIMKFYSNESSMKFTKAMKSHVEEKLQKLKKLVVDVNGRATLKKEGHLLKLEITLPGNIRASKAGDDFYALTNEVVDQLEAQIIRTARLSKTKVRDNILASVFNENDVEDYKVRDKIIMKEEMSLEEAIEEMEILGHQFFTYEDIDEHTTCIIYKRNDGDYGRIILR